MAIIVAPLRKFESNTLTSAEVTDTLKQLFSRLGEHLFKLERKSLGESVFPELAHIITAGEISEVYQQKRGSLEELETFFLSENYRFKVLLQNKSFDFRQEFFQSVQKFIQSAFEEALERLPAEDSLTMRGSCILRRSRLDLDDLRVFAEHYAYVFEEAEKQSLTEEICAIKNDTSFLMKLHEADSVGVLKQWKKTDAKYPQLFKLIKLIQLLPYSNTDIERDFS